MPDPRRQGTQVTAERDNPPDPGATTVHVPTIEAWCEPFCGPEALGAMWRALEPRAAPSVFTSWLWMESWLRASGATPNLVVARSGDAIVGLALVGRSTVRLGPYRVPRLHLNQAGAPDLDCVAIEYNDMLVDAALGDDVRAAMLTALRGRDHRSWRALSWPAARVDPRPAAARAELRAETVKGAPSPHVDLDTLRFSGSDYLAALSANTRQQLRRAMRHWEGLGPLAVERAASATDGHTWLDALAALHQASWTARGRRGAFAQPVFGAFGHALIDAGLETGEVDLLRVRAGEVVLGYLWNLAYGGVVANYQSGIDYAEPRHKPGLVAHALAIQYYLDRRPVPGQYSFLAGDARYKRSLATGSETLTWHVLRPIGWRAPVDRAVETLCRRRAWRSAAVEQSRNEVAA